MTATFAIASSLRFGSDPAALPPAPVPDRAMIPANDHPIPALESRIGLELGRARPGPHSRKEGISRAIRFSEYLATRIRANLATTPLRRRRPPHRETIFLLGGRRHQGIRLTRPSPATRPLLRRPRDRRLLQTGRWLCREPGGEGRRCEHWAIDAVMERRRARAAGWRYVVSTGRAGGQVQPWRRPCRF